MSVLERLFDAIPVDKAACANSDPELFFASSFNLTAIKAAKEICLTCPITKECLLWALQENEQGIWGGLTEDERKRLGRRSMKARIILPAVRPPAPLGVTNEQRTNKAAQRNIVELRNAIEVLGDSIPKDVMELIDIRIANPNLSLAEIGENATIKINKDQVRSRLRTVVLQAKRITRN